MARAEVGEIAMALHPTQLPDPFHGVRAAALRDDPFGCIFNSFDDVFAETDYVAEARAFGNCERCKIPMNIVENSSVLRCPRCMCIQETGTNMYDESANLERDVTHKPRRIYVVGPQRHLFQSVINRGSNVEYAQYQRTHVFHAYHEQNRRMRGKHQQSNGDTTPPFAPEAVNAGAELFCALLRKNPDSVMRNNHKRKIQAACLEFACNMTGYSRTQRDVQEFWELTDGYAQGRAQLRELADLYGLDLDTPEDECIAKINAALAMMEVGDGFTGPFAGLDADRVRSAVHDIVRCAVDSSLGRIQKKGDRRSSGGDTDLRTKVIGALFSVLTRYPGAPAVTVGEVAARCEIRDATVRKFTSCLSRYHKRCFTPIYEKYSLDTEKR